MGDKIDQQLFVALSKGESHKDQIYVIRLLWEIKLTNSSL